MNFANFATQNNASIVVQDITLSSDGAVYFTIIPYKTIQLDAVEESYVNITINSVGTPTPNQILNCMNWDNSVASGCARAIYMSGQNVTVYFENVSPNTIYKVFYVVANEYPLRPIVGTTVYETDTTT